MKQLREKLFSSLRPLHLCVKTSSLLCTHCVFIILIIAFEGNLPAQSPYHGGSADGFSIAEINSVFIGENQSSNLLLLQNASVSGNEFTLFFIHSTTEKLFMEIFNVNGQLIQKAEISPGTREFPIKLNISQGAYFMRIIPGETFFRLIMVTP